MSNSKILKRLEETVVACNRCGFCTSYCPTYLATGSEAHSPRGRNQMFRALLEGKVSEADHARSAIESCLLCGECTSICFSEVPTADLMIQARALINERRKIPWLVRQFFEQVLGHPRRFRLLIKVLFVMKFLGVSTALRKLGVLKKFVPMAHAADEFVQAVPLRFLNERAEAKAFLAKPLYVSEMETLRHEMTKDKKTKSPVMRDPSITVAYFPPCGSQLLRPSIGLATLELLKKLNVGFEIPDLGCCGLPAASAGHLEHVRSLAEENILRLEKAGYEHIVVDDSSCASHLKDLPKYFSTDPNWLPRAQAIAVKVKDLSSFLVARGLGAHLKMCTWNGGPIAYHDPCKAQYGQKLLSPPRELLGQVRHLKINPISEADQCCGGGGTFSVAQPDLSRAVLQSKIKNILATQASTVVTSSTSCLMQLEFGLKASSTPCQVQHLSEFLLRVLTVGR